ncbi:MAG: gliding motility protein GldM [Bacteroidales bacterium]
MAGYKETPRQKMIAMMYLVLTALLALNVSKEILDAFLVVNDSIETTNEKFENKIQEVYHDFEVQYELNPEKVGDEWAEAQAVRRMSRRMVAYVDSLKYQVIAFTEKIPFEQAKVIDLVDVKKKDNYDYPTNFFIGTDTKKGVATDLKDSLNSYRERLLAFVDENRRPLYDKRLGLKTDGEYRNANGQPLNWELYNFYHTILTADVTLMNKIKAEIFNAESDILNYLYASITEEDFKFSGLSAKVIAKSNYVFKGGEYEAEVLVAAVDETQNPVVYFRENADTLTEANINDPSVTKIEGVKGAAKITLPANVEGVRKYAGIIEMLDPTGAPKYYPFKQEFIVARPSATISPTKMNVFYRGVDNPVSISASGKADSELDVRITEGSISRTDTGWVVKDLPPEAYETVISVYAEDNGSKRLMGEQLFRVKRLPDPNARVIGAADGKISVKRLLANPFLICTLPEWVDFQYDFKVLSFTMYIPKGGGYFVTEKSESMMFTDNMKAQLKTLNSNDVIVFRDIKVKGPEGTRKIENISITIQ